MTEKLVIIGGVAGGATAAARARRLNENAQIVLFERGDYISFANCGLPYYIGGIIKKRESLLVTTADAFRKRYRIDIRLAAEVVAINRAEKCVRVKNVITGEKYDESYDKLILSPGAAPIRPPLAGIDGENIFNLRNIPDTDRIKAYVDEKQPKSAVVVGGGFIGLEMAENLVLRGVKTTIVEKLDQVMPPIDADMAGMIHAHLAEKGVGLLLGDGIQAFEKTGQRLVIRTEKGKTLECDMAILSVGVRPENQLARDAGLTIGETGGIAVDASLRTSDPDIFAIGDAVEIDDLVAGMKTKIPLAGPANKQGRIAADNAMGRNSVFKGVLGTSIVQVFDLAVASTGLSEKLLKKNAIPYIASYTHSGSHAGYYPGAEMLAIKLLFAPETGRIVGAQIVGKDGVDKRIDVLATAIFGKMTVFDLEELELAYAPPFGSAKDPVNIAGYVGANILKKDVENINWDQLDDIDPENEILLDLRTDIEFKNSGSIDGALHIPIDSLRDRLGELDREKTYIPFCAVGLRGYLGYRILSQHGYKSKNLSGGFRTYLGAKEQIVL